MVAALEPLHAHPLSSYVPELASLRSADVLGLQHAVHEKETTAKLLKRPLP